MAIESTSLAPGFRFHPTDEELVRYYLRRKIFGKPFRFDAISDIDVYKCEPWDLPDMSRLKSRDLEWYFFSILDKKYGNSSRTNRATEKGYWKTTGKDRAVFHRSRTVGMKKTLVYHCGRAPRGERTNWVMHEYRLVDEELEKAGIAQDAFVLCRIFRKSGSGPKNGEQYGAPFVEEEWEDDELVMVPGAQAAEEVLIGDESYLDGHDLEQILDASAPSEEILPPLNFEYGDYSNYGEESKDFIDDVQKLLPNVGENCPFQEQVNEQKSFDLPLKHNIEAEAVKNEYIGESSNIENSVEDDYLLDEPFLDATNNAPFDGAFLETNDLANPIEADQASFDMLEEYLRFFDAEDDNLMMLGSENLISDQADTQKFVNGGTPQETLTLKGLDKDVSSSSKPEAPEFKPDNTQHPFLKQASSMLESIPAPPAFASEFPSKSSALQFNSQSQASSSVHITANMIQTRNTTSMLFGKYSDVNIFLSFGFCRSDGDSTSSEPMNSAISSKAGSASPRCWLYLMFIWVLVLSMSFKIGTFIYSGKAC